MKKIILIGAGGHSRSCIDVIKSQKKYKVSFLVDKTSVDNQTIKTILESNFLTGYKLNKKDLLISVGQLNNGKLRKKIFEFYKNKGCNFPVIKSKSSYISSNSLIDEGTIIMHKVFINSNVLIGKNCIINTGTIIEHDVVIGNNVHIAPGAIILGGCTIKDNTFIGSGTIVKQNTSIGKNFILPSGAYFKK
jgi:sugar O-acyltransferase (sialic acid O-acetyltransferase NeuD family)